MPAVRTRDQRLQCQCQGRDEELPMQIRVTWSGDSQSIAAQSGHSPVNKTSHAELNCSPCKVSTLPVTTEKQTEKHGLANININMVVTAGNIQC
jgi:hypothetical protein